MTKTNSTSLPVATLNLYTQPAEDRVTSLILQSDGRWQFEDSNYTDLPIATTSIVSGQQDYSLAVTHLEILRVELKDTNGVWRILYPKDQDDETVMALSSLATVTGVPIEYDLLGNSIFLYPTPSFSQVASLKIYFKRGPLHFDFTTGKFTDGTGSTSSSPGFNSLYHDLIAFWSSYNYAIANGLNIANGFFNEIVRKETALVQDYGRRNRDDPQRLTMSPIQFR